MEFLIEEFLKDQKIIGENETWKRAKERVLENVIEIEKKFEVAEDKREIFKLQIKDLINNGKFLPGTPILSNAGNYPDKPLSSCSIPSINSKPTIDDLKNQLEAFSEQDMGIGFNLDDFDDPVRILVELNDFATQLVGSKEYVRPISVMCTISVNHPQIRDFINAKNNLENEQKWFCSICVNLTGQFLDAVTNQTQYMLRNGASIDASALFSSISQSIWSRGEPGVVFIDRITQDNPVPQLGLCNSIVPCGEMSLSQGETCLFGYINLSKFVTSQGIDYEDLAEVSQFAVRFLDDALEYSLGKYCSAASNEIMRKKRRIAVSVCGFAEMLLKMGIPYDSSEAKEITNNIMSLINYQTKIASVDIALQRGAFPGFYETDNKLLHGFYADRFGCFESQTVSKADWQYLDTLVQEYGIRNVSTTAIPPSGRTSKILNTTASIEPFFDFENVITQANSLVSDRDVAKTCWQITPEAQIEMVARFQQFTDESVSKTVNITQDTSIDDVRSMILYAYKLGLKGLTIYRDGSRKNQPNLNPESKSALSAELADKVDSNGVGSQILLLAESPLQNLNQKFFPSIKE